MEKAKYTVIALFTVLLWGISLPVTAVLLELYCLFSGKV